jgi:universal stress protein F
MFNKILVPIDLSEKELSARGVAAAIEIAKTSNAQIRLLAVQPLVPLAFMDYAPPNFDEELRAATEKDLADALAKIDYAKERVSSVMRFGGVYPEVLAEAKDWSADLIVVCSHRPTMATYLIGSNAKTIVRHATCSVLVVR